MILEQIKVNGLDTKVVYSEEFIHQQIKPLIALWQQMAAHKQERVIVFLAAAPGAGKSTLALFMERLCEELQALSLDGFHYPQAYLDSHFIEVDHQMVLMSKVKGSPETFDSERFHQRLCQLKHEDCTWPIYDRTLHDCVDHQIHVTKPIVVIEGNWLLLDEKPWNEYVKYADYTVMIHADRAILKQRLIERKVLGGLSLAAATSFYESSDCLNCERVMQHSLKADSEIDEKSMR